MKPDMHPAVLAYIGMLCGDGPMTHPQRLEFLNRQMHVSMLHHFEAAVKRHPPRSDALRQALIGAVSTANADAARSALYCATSFVTDHARDPECHRTAHYMYVDLTPVDGGWEARLPSFALLSGLADVYRHPTLEGVVAELKQAFTQGGLIDQAPAAQAA